MPKSTDNWAAKEAKRVMAEKSEFERAVEEGLPIEISTGRKIEMRLVELTRFVENGEIPNPLIPLVHEELYGDDAPTTSLAERNKRYMNTLKVARWVAENVLKNRPDPKKPLAGLFNAEILEIYGLANNPAKALARFRLQQAANVANSQAMRETRAESEPAAED